jgi:hypothetical protein
VSAAQVVDVAAALADARHCTPGLVRHVEDMIIRAVSELVEQDKGRCRVETWCSCMCGQILPTWLGVSC